MKTARLQTSLLSRFGWWLTAITAGAFLIKLGVLLLLHDHPLLQPRADLDSAVYLDLARAIANGDLTGGPGTFVVSPLYMYFLAGVLTVTGGSVFAVLVTQVVLGAIAVGLVGDLTRSLLGERAGLIAAGLAAATGYFSFNEVLILQSSLDTFLTAAGLWLLVRAWQTPSARRLVLAGFVLGLQTLNRPNVGLWAVAAIGITALQNRLVVLPPSPKTRKGTAVAAGPKSLRAAILLTTGLALAILPVTIRNYAVSGELAVISAHGGLNFFIGNNADADGIYHAVPGITSNIKGQSRDMQRVAEQSLGHPVSVTQASSWFYDRALGWIGDHPSSALFLFARKCLYVFNAVDVPLNDSYAYYRHDVPSPLNALLVGPWLLFPLAVAGIWFGRTQVIPVGWGRMWIAFALSMVVFALSVAIFFVAGRYRLPMLVVACVGASATIARLWDSGVKRQGTLSVAAIAGLAALFVAVNWPIGMDDGRAAWRSEMVVHHIESGQDRLAEELVSRMEPTHPNPSLLHYRTGKAYVSVNRPVNALPHFERAITLDHTRPEIQLDLGHALLRAGRATEAVPHLQTALDAGVQPAVSAAELIRALADSNQQEALAAFLTTERATATVDLQMLVALARTAMDARDSATVTTLLTRVVVLTPADPAAHLNLAVSYADLGRFQDARREAEAALKLKPDYERAQGFLRAIAGR